MAPQTEPVPPAASAPAPQPAAPGDDVSSRARKLYQAGVADYNAGNLEQAKEEFDSAIALLLASDLNADGHDELRAQFDDMVENISDLEVASIERGDALSPHTYEPPPIESFAGLTFPVDPNIKQRAQQELGSIQHDLPLVSNDYVDGVLTYLQQHGRGYIQTVLKRKGTYEPLISGVLRKEGLPLDLIYLAAGESAFNPYALSRKGAKGIWQFMPGTGALYGLKRDRWVDEREDPVKSTEAAARHLKDLYRTFGDWYLAMAAYDWSPAGVEKAIEHTGYADFWMLRKLNALPAETENYVPIFLATALIGKDPKAYGFDVTPDPPLETDRVRVSEPTDLRLIAGLIDHPVDELVRLNPGLLRWTTPPEANFELNLPAGTRDTFERLIAQVPVEHRVWWRAHKVESGDTVASVARKYRLSSARLIEVNHLTTEDPLQAGSVLLLPLAAGPEASLVRVRERGPRRRHWYKVKRGDTLELVADHFDVTPYEIRHWNHLRSSRLVAGTTLVVYVTSPAPRRSASKRRRTRRRPAAHRNVASSRRAKPRAQAPAKAEAGSSTAQ